MKVETVKVTLPREIIESAEKIGMSKRDLIETMKSFVILDVVANLSKLNQRRAEFLSKKIKESAWRKTKRKL